MLKVSFSGDAGGFGRKGIDLLYELAPFAVYKIETSLLCKMPLHVYINAKIEEIILKVRKLSSSLHSFSSSLLYLFASNIFTIPFP